MIVDLTRAVVCGGTTNTESRRKLAGFCYDMLHLGAREERRASILVQTTYVRVVSAAVQITATIDTRALSYAWGRMVRLSGRPSWLKSALSIYQTDFSNFQTKSAPRRVGSIRNLELVV